MVLSASIESNIRQWQGSNYVWKVLKICALPHLSILPDISSGPFDLATSSDESGYDVSSSVQRKSLGNASSGVEAWNPCSQQVIGTY